MANTEYTRLHITPLNPTLLPTILASSILPSARNITYHTIQTFPEKSYGYLDLPMESADKLKKKLNGSILKGQKIRIETARPQKIHTATSPEPEKPKRESKKRKRDVLRAVNIGERHVKRGWTTPGKDAKDKAVVKSKFTTAPECLFKTVLPPNVASKSAKEKKKRKKDATVVHEFEKTTKYATFLRGSGGVGKKGAREFVEGKGWVDEDGKVVEEVKARSRKSIIESKPAAEESDNDSSKGGNSSDEEVEIKSTLPAMPVEGTVEEDSSSSESSLEEESAVIESSLQATVVETKTLAEDTSSGGSSTDEESDSDVPDAQSKEVPGSENSSGESSSEGESDEEVESTTPKAIVTKAASASDSSSEESSSDESETEEVQSAITSRPQSSAGPALTIKIPTPILAVHPLEALYKRPKTDANPNPTSSFSFFGADNNEEVEVETQLQVPLTPFTQKDFEFRGLRSAAPTPDTAHPNKRFIWPTEDDDDDNEASSPIQKDGKPEEGKSESNFQKWFWENRGETNRAWKKRRKEVAKEKRQRENRKRSDRAV
jgi:hypothetical protein